MFRINEKWEGNIQIYSLEDESSGCCATVVPACGAILNHFSIPHDDGPLNVIQGYEHLIDFGKQAEEKGFRSCKLSPFVCRLENAEYVFGEKKYEIRKFMLGKHAIHGLLYDAKFEVVRTGVDEKSATLVCAYSYRAENRGYPFHYDIEVEYSLRKANRLRVITRVTNQDPGIIPIADGWHPYFGFGGKIDDLLLEFQSKEVVEFDDDLIPTGNLIPYQEYGSLRKIESEKLDHCFTVNFYECQPMLVLKDPVKKVHLEIQPSDNYAFLQVYTPEDRASIALENLSAAPDSFNNTMGLHVLSPGETMEFKLFYILRDLNKS